MKLFVFLMFLISSTASLFSHSADDILGYWYAPLQKDNVPVAFEVFKHNGMYYAYAFGWKDTLDVPKNYRDSKNPNQDLRQRDIKGTVFLFDIKFNEKSEKWGKGTIYRYKTGKTYYISKGNLSEDKGTLHWRAGKDKYLIFGKNMAAWTRIPPQELQAYLDKEDKPLMDEVIKNISQR